MEEQNLDNNLIKSIVNNSQDIASIEEKISNSIAIFQKDLDEKRDKEKELKEALKVSMRDNNVKKFENEIISLTYITSTKRNIFDSKKLEEERPEIYNNYIKEIDVSDSIRIKIK